MKQYELREKITKNSYLYTIVGSLILVSIWQILLAVFDVNTANIPRPLDVFTSFKELHFENALIRNAFYTIGLNLCGIISATLISIPVGFLIGLKSRVRASFEIQVNSFRYIPITLLIGVFINIFGISALMKIAFLAFGTLVYMIPAVISRIDEVENTYIHTMKTLRANKWQEFKYLYFPYVLGKVFSDVIILLGISWTYITIAEMINATSGLGFIANLAASKSRPDKTFAIIILISIISFIIDKYAKRLDIKLFPWKNGGQVE